MKRSRGVANVCWQNPKIDTAPRPSQCTTQQIVPVTLPSTAMSSSSHPTALLDPKAAIRRVINLGWDEKVVRAVYLVGDLDSLVDSLVDSIYFDERLLDELCLDAHLNVLGLDAHLDRLLNGLLDRVDLDRLLDRLLDQVNRVLGHVVKKSMVRRVRRNPEIAVKILHGLSGTRIVVSVSSCHCVL
ncbi:hypothetical protein ARMGADRAFT_50955 [Armillaria gallica]|uniref:Uncharacterized protein n=1 Tax=Armillaria gallica TaxID=47427 RepID=A0A2H3EYG6_ARMGA|nr:hypothetical protein ARMGADRAFT_50955 [Armillaria gallica]